MSRKIKNFFKILVSVDHSWISTDYNNNKLCLVGIVQSSIKYDKCICLTRESVPYMNISF